MALRRSNGSRFSTAWLNSSDGERPSRISSQAPWASTFIHYHSKTKKSTAPNRWWPLLKSILGLRLISLVENRKEGFSGRQSRLGAIPLYLSTASLGVTRVGDKSVQLDMTRTRRLWQWCQGREERKIRSKEKREKEKEKRENRANAVSKQQEIAWAGQITSLRFIIGPAQGRFPLRSFCSFRSTYRRPWNWRYVWS